MKNLSHMEMSALLSFNGTGYDDCEEKKVERQSVGVKYIIFGFDGQQSRKGSYYFMFDKSTYKRIPRKNINFNWT